MCPKPFRQVKIDNYSKRSAVMRLKPQQAPTSPHPPEILPIIFKTDPSNVKLSDVAARMGNL
jgi:hypothetical protein